MQQITDTAVTARNGTGATFARKPWSTPRVIESESKIDQTEASINPPNTDGGTPSPLTPIS